MSDKLRRLRSFWKSWRGQSLVEFTLLLPVLLVMVSGLVEFGFLLNQYLDIIDTAREVARLAADDDPVHNLNGEFEPKPVDPEPAGFYKRAENATTDLLARAGQLSLESDQGDDLVISVFAIESGSVVARYPPTYDDGVCQQGGDLGWRRYCNQTSKFTNNADIEDRVDPGAPNTGLVVVEIYYHYDMVLALPWITTFMGNPVTLHAYSIMPNASATP